MATIVSTGIATPQAERCDVRPVAIGGFSIDGMMAHLNNLALRYVAADAHRQMAFKELIGGVQMILAIGFLVFRRHAFRPFRDFDRSMPHG